VTPQAAPAKEGVRIGSAAKQAGTTARTIRYYEEIGLLPSSNGRAGGAHRLYTEDDIERVRELLRLKNLLGLSLDELKTVIEAENAREHLKARFLSDASDEEKRAILDKLLENVDHQLALVNRRRKDLDELEADLTTRRRRAMRRRRELGDQ
jgi:MerR family transcriptional regulator, repressor of the yfmOP operon